jgi:hypothetical protein
MARIVVTGYMIRHPVAGNILAFFQYLMGLHLLGHQVVYLEESGWAYSCYNPDTREWQDSPEAGLKIVRGVLAKYKLNIPVCYVNRETGNITGIEWNELKQLLKETDLLLNIGGVCWLPEFRLCNRRALIDMDPFFSQVQGFASKVLDDYQLHFSYGTNIGNSDCKIPTCGIKWLSIVPPVIPELWTGAKPRDNAPFTTIGNWGAYGEIVLDGESYGQKDVEFLRILNLPKYTRQRLELAISGADEEVKEQLRQAGWLVRDAGEEVSVDLQTYKSYIAQSRAEFSVAKNAYVKTKSGWFSDRTVCYLAAGIPAIIQDTGFSNWLPTESGILSFSSMDEAIRRIETVNSDYLKHRRAALAVAEEFFSYRVVIPKILEEALK